MPHAPIIGIDGSRATVRRPTGTESYSIELLRAMAKLAPQDPIRVYLNARNVPTDISLPGEPRLIPARRFWTAGRLSMEMIRRPPAVLFVPAHVIPPVHPPSVVTIHDLGYIAEPNAFSPRRRRELEWSTRWSVRAASAIIAVSEKTGRDLVERLGVHPDRIVVIYHGVSSDFRPLQSQDSAQLRSSLDLPNRYILSVGTLDARKNLATLIEAFEQLANHGVAHDLVLIGTPGWNASAIFSRIATSPFASRIRYRGYVRRADLPAHYGLADLVALPAPIEGFGMPALEAMASGTPVVAAASGALPEICGKAAVLVDARDPTELANGISSVLDDASLRGKLVDLGLVRSGNFTWSKSARATLALLRTIRDNYAAKPPSGA